MLDEFRGGAEWRLKGLMEPGESILWTGRPQGIPNLGRASLRALIGLGLAVTTTLRVIGTLQGPGNWDRGESVPPSASHNIVIATVYALSLLPLTVVLLKEPLRAALDARRTLYALTDRRALILWRDMLGDERLATYPPEALAEWKVERREDGSGHLIFEERNDGGGFRNLAGFLEIPAVGEVEPLVRKMLACPFEILPSDEPEAAGKSPDSEQEPDFDGPVIVAARRSRLSRILAIWCGTTTLIGGLLYLMVGEPSGFILLVLGGFLLDWSPRQPRELAISADHRLVVRRASGASASIPIADILRVETGDFFDLRRTRILIRHRLGTLRLPNDFDNIHGLVAQIRRINPAVEIDGL